ncbi:transcriptional regulator, AsnC family [Tistlia consotensis]|uniref:Transcriptional regulator, AsnC family n=1 Tax=Tistlia consotensis USBA 355 TaxID=560819 RepID=A0A1Y6C8H8_9PROT|nr:Lrp/AsnC family transcriptional regulator [Tistlia consotensis]SMF51530.1 transcriptional regulator, AsnC family [Tistlia consotensis USBA 355]SNR84080.1 transcriptional regulator, AsnC family [Tistlia consotensis]
MKPAALDALDRRLLDLLQQDAGRSLESLAGEVALSAPAVQRRIRRLREGGVITGEVVLVEPAAVGLPMTFVVIVELERERADQIDGFRRKAAAEPLVQQCYYVTGEGDFVLIAQARDMDDFEALTRRLLFDDPNVRRFRTSVVMGKPLRGTAVPAGHAG